MSTNKEFKNETVGLIDEMIKYADKGPSGFWTEDYEGCGNPEIFPEFNEGLKHGRLIQKNHYLCPWNTAILFGNGHGNITTGCYHSCSIQEAKYLPPEMLKAVLCRFRKNLVSGKYDDLNCISPLLNSHQQAFIEKQKELESKKQEKSLQEETKRKTKASSSLCKRFSDDEQIQSIIISCYCDDEIVNTEYGMIDFRPTGMKDVIGAENLSYDDYIEVQFLSAGKQRTGFLNGVYNIPLGYKGCIEKISNNKVCFKRVWIEYMYSDGVCRDDKEDHVWMDIDGFENFKEGDSVSFIAEVYRYMKTGNGKSIDYGLRNPQGIKKIEPYNLPSNKELMLQDIQDIICETCFFSEQCNHNYCIRNPKEIKTIKKQMLEMASGDKAEEKK